MGKITDWTRNVCYMFDDRQHMAIGEAVCIECVCVCVCERERERVS